MAYTITLPIGRPYTLVQNVEYALPPIRCLVNATNNPTTLEQSNDKTNWVAVTLDDDENVEAAATWIRSTGVDTVISIKRF